MTDYTARECREQMKQLEYDVTGEGDPKKIPKIMEEWACFRELLARHKGKNQSQLDLEEDDDYRRGFHDAIHGRDCLACSHEYVQGYKRGKEIAKSS